VSEPRARKCLVLRPLSGEGIRTAFRARQGRRQSVGFMCREGMATVDGFSVRSNDVHIRSPKSRKRLKGAHRRLAIGCGWHRQCGRRWGQDAPFWSSLARNKAGSQPKQQSPYGIRNTASETSPKQRIFHRPTSEETPSIWVWLRYPNMAGGRGCRQWLQVNPSKKGNESYQEGSHRSKHWRNSRL